MINWLLVWFVEIVLEVFFGSFGVSVVICCIGNLVCQDLVWLLVLEEWMIEYDGGFWVLVVGGSLGVVVFNL